LLSLLLPCVLLVLRRGTGHSIALREVSHDEDMIWIWKATA
jgi:hypothetical protein